MNSNGKLYFLVIVLVGLLVSQCSFEVGVKSKIERVALIPKFTLQLIEIPEAMKRASEMDSVVAMATELMKLQNNICVYNKLLKLPTDSLDMDGPPWKYEWIDSLGIGNKLIIEQMSYDNETSNEFHFWYTGYDSINNITYDNWQVIAATINSQGDKLSCNLYKLNSNETMLNYFYESENAYGEYHKFIFGDIYIPLSSQQYKYSYCNIKLSFSDSYQIDEANSLTCGGWMEFLKVGSCKYELTWNAYGNGTWYERNSRLELLNSDSW